MEALKLLYFFDPLCGWCYASAPALAQLAESYPQALVMMPSGLFANENSRPMTAEWAGYAKSNDVRIMQMTGQSFTERYFEQVLKGENRFFDSGPGTRAMTALRDLDNQLESRFLHLAQQRRYVDGLDTCDAEVLGHIAAEITVGEPYALVAAEFSDRLLNDQTLAQAAAARILETQQLMAGFGISGVPQLVVQCQDKHYLLSGHTLYSGGETVLNSIKEIMQTA